MYTPLLWSRHQSITPWYIHGHNQHQPSAFNESMHHEWCSGVTWTVVFFKYQPPTHAKVFAFNYIHALLLLKNLGCFSPDTFKCMLFTQYSWWGLSITESCTLLRKINWILSIWSRSITVQVYIGSCSYLMLRVAIALALIHNLAGGRHSNLYINFGMSKATSCKLKQYQRLKSDLHNRPTCPPWKYHKYQNSNSICVCGPGIHNYYIVDCKDNQLTIIISLLSCHYM